MIFIPRSAAVLALGGGGDLVRSDPLAPSVDVDCEGPPVAGVATAGVLLAPFSHICMSRRDAGDSSPAHNVWKKLSEITVLATLSLKHRVNLLWTVQRHCNECQKHLYVAHYTGWGSLLEPLQTKQRSVGEAGRGRGGAIEKVGSGRANGLKEGKFLGEFSY